MLLLKELVDKYKNEQILERLKIQFPEEEENLPGYLSVLNEIRNLIPIETNMVLCIDVIIDQDGRTYRVYGTNGLVFTSDQKVPPPMLGKEVPFMVDVISWDRWLGMKTRYYMIEDLEAIAAYLYAMTAAGFSQEEIRDKKSKIEQHLMATMGMKFKKQDSVPWDEIIERLKNDKKKE